MSLMWSQKDSVSSNRTPRIFNVDDTEIVFPAFDTVDGSYVDRRRCLVLKKIISDLSGLIDRYARTRTAVTQHSLPNG